MQQLNGNPLRKSRRMTGTIPHSHMGKIRPSSALRPMASTWLRGMKAATANAGGQQARGEQRAEEDGNDGTQGDNRHGPGKGGGEAAKKAHHVQVRGGIHGRKRFS